MVMVDAPEIRELDARDVHALLARNITGRIGFVVNDEVEIRPVSYVYAEDFIYLRSSATALLTGTDPGGTRVGFEVDEIQSTTCWRSVVVRGTLFRLSRDSEHEEWMRAVGKLRRLMPEALREEDRLGHRTEIFRILIREATGRAMG
jgi:nitroimidazol reductase NimA-like FMN-containing flavoprotein (pyridoxamine 5'-phosphate oxidase superfamily)